MNTPSIKRGDIVRIKREWLNPGETGDELYLVLEECGINRILIQALNTGLPLAPTSVVNIDWVIFHTNINNHYPHKHHERIHQSKLHHQKHGGA